MYIATAKSTKILKDADKRYKAGEVVDWDEVFRQVDEASAKTLPEQIKAIVRKKN